MIEQPSVILCWIICRQLSRRRRIEHIVDHLSAVEDACVDHLVKRGGFADCGEPKETCLALPTCSLECRHHLTEHLLDTERFPAAVLGDCIMQVEDIDPVTAQSHQAVFERCCHGISDATETSARQSNFRSDDRVRWF